MSQGKVKNLALTQGNGRLWTPLQMLREGQREIESGERTCTKALVIALDDAEGRYSTGFLQSGLSVSQILALVEVFKARLLSDSGVL